MADGTYKVLPKRVAAATVVLRHLVEELSPEDVAGIFLEAGLGECYLWEDAHWEGAVWVDEQARLSFTDLQTVVAAVALTAAKEGLAEEVFG